MTLTTSQRIAMIRAAHKRHARAARYAEFVAIGAGDSHDVPCVIGREDAAQDISRPTVATRELWGVR